MLDSGQWWILSVAAELRGKVRYQQAMLRANGMVSCVVQTFLCVCGVLVVSRLGAVQSKVVARLNSANGTRRLNIPQMYSRAIPTKTGRTARHPHDISPRHPRVVALPSCHLFRRTRLARA